MSAGERTYMHTYLFQFINNNKNYVKLKGEFQGYLFKRRTPGQDSEPEGCQVLIERGL